MTVYRRKMNNIFVFLCVVAVLLSAAAPQCPSFCTCAEDVANCKSLPSLQPVLTDLPKSMQTILLQGQGLSQVARIEPRALQNFSSLHYMSITEFRLSLSSHAFYGSVGGQSSLQLLELTTNNLSSCNVESSAFRGLSNLTTLNLFQNDLDVLKAPWFSDLASLHTLNVQSNKISYLPPRIFATLRLLKILNASRNLIQYLSTDTFCGLGALYELDLSNNKLAFIASDAFEPFHNLKQLNLNGNQLVTLAAVPESVQKMQLHHNPWECSCQLMMLLESRRKAVEDAGSLMCGNPWPLKGKLILDLHSTECSTTIPVPATTASHVAPTLGAQAVVGGFIGGCLLVGAIWLVTWLGRRHWREQYPRSRKKDSYEAKGKLQTKTPSETPMELDASNLNANLPVIASHQTINETENVKGNQVEQGEEPLKIPTELWTAMERVIRENNTKNKRLRPCKTLPCLLQAANVVHIQNERTVSVSSAIMDEGKGRSWGNTEREKMPIHSATSSSLHNLKLTKKGQCKLQEKMQEDTPCKAILSKEEKTALQVSKSSNDHKVNDTPSLEMEGRVGVGLPEYQQTLSQSHQCEEPILNTSQKHNLQQGSKHHSESSQFTKRPKMVPDSEFNVCDAVNVENNISFITGMDVTTTPILIFAHDEHEQPGHELNEIEVPIGKESDGNTLGLNSTLSKAPISLVGSSAGPNNGVTLTNNTITEDKVSQAGSATTSFSWPYAWSVQSQENWKQSTTTLDSAPLSERPETNLSLKLSSKTGAPMQSSTRIIDQGANLDVEERTKRSEPRFQNTFARTEASTNTKLDLEPLGHIQCPTHPGKLLDRNAEERRDSNLHKRHFGNTNYTKKMYKSVFKLVDEVQFPAAEEKMQNKASQNSPILSDGGSRDKLKLQNILIPLSVKNKDLQQFESSDPALKSAAHLSPFYSRWFYKREFGTGFGKWNPTVPEGVDWNTVPNVHSEKSRGSPTPDQIQTKAEGVTVVRTWKDIHLPKHFVKLNPPTRGERFADDELTVIGVFHNLRKTLDFD